MERALVNYLACEGSQRVMRPETLDLWAARLETAGLRPIGMYAEVLSEVLGALKKFPDGFSLELEREGAQLLWQGHRSFFVADWGCQEEGRMEERVTVL